MVRQQSAHEKNCFEQKDRDFKTLAKNQTVQQFHKKNLKLQPLAANIYSSGAELANTILIPKGDSRAAPRDINTASTSRGLQKQDNSSNKHATRIVSTQARRRVLNTASNAKTVNNKASLLTNRLTG